jgi:RNA methyltransferase, RsmD family
MRIIGGSFKGVKIFEAFDKNTRPLRDLVKESIFNILEYSKDSKVNFNNSLILDLFSGTGSFGLECISRGAAKVYFFENYNQSIEVLSKNIKKLKCENKARVCNQDAFNFFENKELMNKKLDLIFLDPPYKEENIKMILENVEKLKL